LNTSSAICGRSVVPWATIAALASHRAAVTAVALATDLALTIIAFSRAFRLLPRRVQVPAPDFLYQFRVVFVHDYHPRVE
jgi:hypothetical protein